LLHNNFKYLHIGINKKTNKNFWVFENSHDLDDYFHNKYQIHIDVLTDEQIQYLNSWESGT
jgi:S-adenosylhomocysteine hydrolase